MKVLFTQHLAERASSVQLFLKQYNCQVVICEPQQDLLPLIAQHNPNVIITDFVSSSANLALLPAIKQSTQFKTPILVITGFGQEKLIEKAFEFGADDFVHFSCSAAELWLRLNILHLGIARQVA